jgi:hypothetical protein
MARKLLAGRSVCQAVHATMFVKTNATNSLSRFFAGVPRVAGGPLWPFIVSGKGGYEIHDSPAYFRVVDPGEREVQMQTFGGRQEIGDIGRIRIFRETQMARRGIYGCLEGRRPFEKEGRRNVEGSRNLLKPARADSVGALFVFLDLLKRQTQGVAQFFLTHAKHDAPHTDAAADVPVDRVRYFFHEFRSNHRGSAVSFESQDAGTLYGVGFLYRKSGPPHIGGPDFSRTREFCFIEVRGGGGPPLPGIFNVEGELIHPLKHGARRVFRKLH